MFYNSSTMVIHSKMKNTICGDLPVFKRNSLAVCFQQLDSNHLKLSLIHRHIINSIKILSQFVNGKMTVRKQQIMSLPTNCVDITLQYTML